MSRFAKYFLLGTPENSFYDFDLTIGELSLAGGSIYFAGSRSVDAFFTRPGLSFDFTVTGAGADRIYFPSTFGSYTLAKSGSVMTLSRGSGSNIESVQVMKSTSAQASDQLVFADGTISTFDLYDALVNDLTLPAPTGESSLNPQGAASSQAVRSGTIKAFALDPDGEIFVSPAVGMKLVVAGNRGIDTVFVKAGTDVDATNLGVGKDVVYLQGSWADYEKVVGGNTITFSRQVDGELESVKVVGGPSIAQNDQLIFADGGVGSLAALQAIQSNSDVAINSVADYDPSLQTPSGSIALTTTAFTELNSLDVRSDIVLTFTEAVAAQVGKFIRIVDLSEVGFRGESGDSSVSISVTDDSQVTISGNRVIINPTGDLDLSSNYRIEMDEGAFAGVQSGTLTQALATENGLLFSTVTPGQFSTQLAAASTYMDDTGSVITGASWLDLEGIGSPSNADGFAMDLGSKDFVLVAKDYDDGGGNLAQGYDGISTGTFYVSANNFGAGDLIYIDNQYAAANDLGGLQIINSGTPPTAIRFAGTGSGLGGYIDVTLAPPVAGGTFDSLDAWKATLGIDYYPVTSDSDHVASDQGADTTAPNVAVSSSRMSLGRGETAILSFELSELSTDFTIDDISVTGGQLSNFNGTGLSYSAVFTPADNSNLTATIQVASGVFSDSAGNFNIDGASPDNTVQIAVNTQQNKGDEDTAIVVQNNGIYTAVKTVSEVFSLDASQSISAEISGFRAGDALIIQNLQPESELYFTDDQFGDGTVFLNAGAAILELSGLVTDNFPLDLSGFEAQFGAGSLQGVTTIQTITQDGTYEATSLRDVFVIHEPIGGGGLNLTIDGFDEGDVLAFLDVSEVQGINMTDTVPNDGQALLVAGETVIDMTSLPQGFFNSEDAFLAAFGDASLHYGPWA